MADTPQQIASEPVTFGKWLSGFIKAATWAKALIFGIIFCVIVGVPTGIWFGGYFFAKEKFYKVGYEAGLDWADKHPKQVVTGDGCTINNNVQKPNNHFQASAFPFRIGWCE